jgi:hypothetical protein
VSPVKYELGFISQKTTFFIVTAEKTSNLTCFPLDFGEFMYLSTCNTSNRYEAVTVVGVVTAEHPVGWETFVPPLEWRNEGGRRGAVDVGSRALRPVLVSSEVHLVGPVTRVSTHQNVILANANCVTDLKVSSSRHVVGHTSNAFLRIGCVTEALATIENISHLYLLLLNNTLLNHSSSTHKIMKSFTGAYKLNFKSCVT